MALAEARSIGADVAFIRPRHVVNEALFDLDSDEVRIIQPNLLRRSWFASRVVIGELTRELCLRSQRALRTLREEARGELGRHATSPNVPPELRARIKELRTKLSNEELAEADDNREYPYYRRRLILTPVRVFLREAVAQRARDLATEFGIGPNTRIVAVHAREPGYKMGREAQDKGTKRDDSVRNARIEHHFEAMDYLVKRGYTVVRIGDPTMVPVRRPGVVDLATSPRRTPELEVYLLLRSEFLICGESGLLTVSYLTNTPMLTVNATDPMSAYPVRADGIYIMKKVFDRQTGRLLTLTDLLTEDYLSNLRYLERYQYVENSGEEILAGVCEMCEWLGGSRTETPKQAQFRDMATRVGDALKARLGYVRKWGPDQGFLGDGRIASFYAERYM